MPSQPGFFKRLGLAGLNVLVPLQTGFLVLYFCIRWLGGSDLWFIDLASFVLPWLFFPSVVLVPLALVCRTRIRLILALVPAACFALVYGHLYLPRMPAQVEAPTFRAMAYNVLFENPHAEQIARVIEAQDPDFVGLRELEPDIAAFLEQRLADRYPYHEVDEWCGFWSRYPILHYESPRLVQGMGRPAQQFTLDVDGRPVTVLSIHTRYPEPLVYRPFGTVIGIPIGFATEARDADIRDVIARADQIDGPLVVLGDLNLTDQQSIYPRLTREFRDAHREAGWGMGFTFTRFRKVRLPMWRIDYILYSPDLVAVRTTTGAYGGSDHRPVIADFGFASAP